LKKINVPIIPKDLGTRFKSSDVWFVCQTNKFVKSIRPQKYSNLYNGSGHQKFEKIYRQHIKYYPDDISFVKASLFNATDIVTPEQILLNQGYTYYFKLLPEQIEKCLFSVTIDGENALIKGIQGFAGAYKVWNEREVKERSNILNDKPRDNIEVIIPFKVKPQYYIPEVTKRIFYHGSSQRFKTLNKFSYVTPYKEDAIKFAIPWSSDELLIKDREMSVIGRPPKCLYFKKDVEIEDSKVYLYSVKGIDTISSGTNSGRVFPWNRITLKEASEENKSLKLEKKIMSWKKELSIINI
tara:strand:+ start:6364 stop:7254 length:891 start_codon:yes stop_codon:yes gene_type:complete